MGMDINVEGENNLVAAHDVYQISMGSRVLTKDERRKINTRVNLLAELYDEPPWDTWKTLHRALGVENIDQMTLEHRDQVEVILNLLEERGELRHQLHPDFDPVPDPAPPEPHSVFNAVKHYPVELLAVAIVALIVGAVGTILI